jgi:hypothetical protein
MPLELSPSLGKTYSVLSNYQVYYWELAVGERNPYFENEFMRKRIRSKLFQWTQLRNKSAHICIVYAITTLRCVPLLNVGSEIK